MNRVCLPQLDPISRKTPRHCLLIENWDAALNSKPSLQFKPQPCSKHSALWNLQAAAAGQPALPQQEMGSSWGGQLCLFPGAAPASASGLTWALPPLVSALRPNGQLNQTASRMSAGRGGGGREKEGSQTYREEGGAASPCSPGFSVADHPDVDTVETEEAKEAEEVELSLEATLPGAIAQAETDTDVRLRGLPAGLIYQ